MYNPSFIRRPIILQLPEDFVVPESEKSLFLSAMIPSFTQPLAVRFSTLKCLFLDGERHVFIYFFIFVFVFSLPCLQKRLLQSTLKLISNK